MIEIFSEEPEVKNQQKKRKRTFSFKDIEKQEKKQRKDIVSSSSSSSSSSEAVTSTSSTLKESEDNVSSEEKHVKESSSSKNLTWKDLGLDQRILNNILKIGFEKPTNVQQRTIPLALKGKDLIAKAETGTGKTAAYSLPAIQLIMSNKSHSRKSSTIPIVLIIVPTIELSKQVHNHILKLTNNLNEECTSVLLEDIEEYCNESDQSGKNIQNDKSKNIYIGTPSQYLHLLNGRFITLNKECIRMVIIDEADLVLEEQLKDMKHLLEKYLPRFFQCLMMSATLEPKGFSELRKHFFNNPILVDCTSDKSKGDELDVLGQNLAQYSLEIPDTNEERIFYLHYLISYPCKGGKVIIFVNKTEDAVIIYSALKTMAINKVALLIREMPTLCRFDIIEKFNQNEYRILISAMENQDTKMAKQSESVMSQVANSLNQVSTNKELKQYREVEDKVSELVVNMARGIDFQKVAAVINFNLPDTLSDYVHRIGRTARSGNVGISITFVTPSTQQLWKRIKKTMEKIRKQSVEEYPVDKDHVDRIRYRFSDLYNEIFSKRKQIFNTLLKNELLAAKKLKTAIKTKKYKENIIHGKIPEISIAGIKGHKLPGYLKLALSKDQLLENGGLLDDDDGGSKVGEADERENIKRNKQLSRRKKQKGKDGHKEGDNGDNDGGNGNDNDDNNNNNDDIEMKDLDNAIDKYDSDSEDDHDDTQAESPKRKIHRGKPKDILLTIENSKMMKPKSFGKQSQSNQKKQKEEERLKGKVNKMKKTLRQQVKSGMWASQTL